MLTPSQYWDVMLEDLADWIESFAKAFRRDVTLNDYERILECMPQDRNLKSYRSNLDKLFWHGAGSRRTADLLTQLPLNAYEEAYSVLVNHPPHEDWKLKEIMSQIHDKGIVCKSVMLHVGFWFNPELEEPANRANVKPPMFHHLKLAFSKYRPHDPLYEDDESWKPQALALQRAVLNFTLEWWPRSNAIIGNLGMLREFTTEKYLDYISTFFWNSLLHEVRKNTNVPFRLPGLTQFRNVNDLPSNDAFASNRRDSGIEKLQDQAQHIIQEMSSDGQSSDSENDEESSEEEDEPQYVGSNGQTYNRGDSVLSEPLAVESEEDEDIIHVQTPSPSYSSRSKKRKLQHSNADVGHQSEHENGPEIPRKRIVKLKVPNLFPPVKQPARATSAETRSSARKRPISKSNYDPPQVRDASPSAFTASPHLSSQFNPAPPASMPPTESRNRTVPHPTTEAQEEPREVPQPDVGNSATEPIIQPPAWNHVEQDTARRAMEELENKARSTASTSQDPENRRHTMSNPPAHRPRNPQIPPSHETLTPKPPTPSPVPHSAPQSAPQPYYHAAMFANTPVASSPVPIKTKTELAVDVLQDDYGHILDIQSLLAAIKFLKNEQEAGIFLSLRPGNLRDKFLLDGINTTSSS
jgi:hypothetical protein